MRTSLLALLFLLLVLPVRGEGRVAEGTNPQATAPQGVAPGSQEAWRVRIRDAAVVRDSMVRLGDIADPLGNMTPQAWNELAAKPLWPAPETSGKPLSINRQRLSTALRQSLGDLADACILPASLAIQRDGSVLREDGLRSLVVNTLTPRINALGGHGELRDFRLPAYAFTAHDGQSIVLEETPVAPGRISLRFAVREMDGSIVRRFTGSVFLDLWMDVPCATRPLNRGDAITPDAITFKRSNLAYQKGTVWDGRGGPWQIIRSVGASQPIMATDLTPLAAVRKGDRVTLLYERGNVQLRTVVEAMEDGGAGDTIAVRNMDTKRQIYATVRDNNTVISK